MDKDLQVVGFRIGRETFGLPISTVREIVRVPEITSVPNAPDYIEGVINLRGRIIPVVDLRKRFGEPVAEKSKKNRIVVVEMEQRSIGLIVNSASEVLRIPPSDIESPNNVFQEGELNYITGVGKLHGRLVILLDLNRILQRGELRRLEEAALSADSMESVGSVPVTAGPSGASGGSRKKR
jgi:purine-binding chemotaxis protein CheW